MQLRRSSRSCAICGEILLTLLIPIILTIIAFVSTIVIICVVMNTILIIRIMKTATVS